MASLIHIAEVALLLFVAYVVGWAIGYGARRLTIRAPKPVTAIPADRLAAAMGQSADETALVTAPTIVEVEKVPAVAVEPVVAAVVSGTVAPVAPTPETSSGPASAIETPKSASPTAPLILPDLKPEPAPEPAIVAEALAPSIVAAEPPRPAAEAAASAPEAIALAELPPPETAPSLPSAPVTPPPAPGETPVAPTRPAMPASTPGQAWSGATNGRPARIEPLGEVARLKAALPAAQAPDEPGLDLGLLASLEAELNPPPAPVASAPVEPVVPPPAPAEQLAAEPFAAAPTPPEPVLVEPAPEPPKVEIAAEPPRAGRVLLSPTSIHDDALLASIADRLKLDDAPRSSAAPETDAADDMSPELAAEPPVAAEPAPPAPAPEPPTALSAAPPKPVEFDEDAAMRAIEGGWSRRDTRAMSGAVELSDVTAAVAAAQMAVENVLAQNGVSAERQAVLGKPRGLLRPRDGVRDDLKQINGLSPLDESTLNNLGIYHFDQIAAWDQKEVLWMENHAFARGRIGREGWQEQARALVERGAVRAVR